MNRREQREAEGVEQRERDDQAGGDRAGTDGREPEETGKENRAVAADAFENAGRQRQIEVQEHEQSVAGAETAPDERNRQDEGDSGDAIERVVRRHAIAGEVRV